MHLATTWHHQGDFREELFADSCISSIITSSALIPARYFCVKEASWGLLMPQDCGYVAVPLGWESFMSSRLQLARGAGCVRRGQAAASHCCGTFAVNGNLISPSLITHPTEIPTVIVDCCSITPSAW